MNNKHIFNDKLIVFEKDDLSVFLVLSHSKLDDTKEVPAEFMIKQKENTHAELEETLNHSLKTCALKPSDAVKKIIS